MIRYVLATGEWARDGRLAATVARAARLPGDPAPLEAASLGRPGLALHASFPSAPARPRRVWADEDSLVVLDGIADLALSSHDSPARVWARLAAAPEGQYSALFLDGRARAAELVNDALGLGQVYWRADERGWLVANGVRVLQSLAGDTELDPEGASLLLATGWVGADRTLAARVRVVPPGARWTWREGDPEPRRSVHSTLRELVDGARDARHARGTLRAELGALCRRVAGDYARSECTLTAGRDSRVLCSLLAEQRVPCAYYTDGIPDSFEVRISRVVAAAKGVPHRVREKGPDVIAPRWSEAADRLLSLTDGMVSLWQLADTVWDGDAAAPRPVTFWGVGGEIARAVYGSTRWYLSRKTPASVAAHLERWIVRDGGGLLASEGVEFARRYVRDFVTATHAEGVGLADVPDAFYLRERVRRWAGTNARKSAASTDLFSPFCTRLYARRAFALRPQLRYAEALHREILAADPQLFDLPSNAGAWRVQAPWLVLLEQEWRTRVSARRDRTVALFDSAGFDPYSVLERVLPSVREACLDARDALAWRLVDRDGFARVTGSGLSAAERRAHALFLYQVITLVEYERSLRALARVPA